MEGGREVHAVKPFCYRCWVHLYLSGGLGRWEGRGRKCLRSLYNLAVIGSHLDAGS